MGDRCGRRQRKCPIGYVLRPTLSPAIRKHICHSDTKSARKILNMKSRLSGLRTSWYGALVIRVVILLGPLAPGWAFAQVSATLNGAPVQVTPYMPEPGVPTITIPQGTLNTNSAGPSSGAGSGGTSGASSSDALDTMLAQSWGSSAIANAEALGLNPSALAATCVIESGCGANDGDGSGAQGPFQMYPAAFQEGLQTALAEDPSLSSEIVQGSAGIDDPTTEAIAASGYLMQANQSLVSAGVSSPTVLDARGYYNFGPTAGTQIAQASDSDLMSDYVSSTALGANNIPSTETVGQWKSSVSSVVGSAANQSVLS